MIRTLFLASIAANLLVSCSSPDVAYQPRTKPEQFEFSYDRLDVYPNDVRSNLLHYTNMPVVWAGVIVSTDAREEDTPNKIDADTVFEHHYFDWVQDKKGGDYKLALSPRGEGKFTTAWKLEKTTDWASAANAEKFAHKGRLAIVYGMPELVQPDGTVVLKYRYVRIIDQAHFTTNQYDYGRLGEPFRVIDCKYKTNFPSLKE